MPLLPESIILVWAPLAPLFSHRVWLHAQLLLLGAVLLPGTRTVTAALRVMGLATKRRFTNYHRVLHRATWSATQGSSDSVGLARRAAGDLRAMIVLGRVCTLGSTQSLRGHEPRRFDQRTMGTAQTAAPGSKTEARTARP
jgi:hypothetical protein